MSFDSLSSRSPAIARPPTNSPDLLAFTGGAPAPQVPTSPVQAPPGNPAFPALPGQGSRSHEQIFLRTEFLMFGSPLDALGQGVRMTAHGNPLGLHYEQALTRALSASIDQIRHARDNFTGPEKDEMARAVADTLADQMANGIRAGSDSFNAAIRSTIRLAFNHIRERRGELPHQQQQSGPMQGPPTPGTQPADWQPSLTFERPSFNFGQSSGSPSEPLVSASRPELTPEQISERVSEFLPRAGGNAPVIYGPDGADAARRAAVEYNGESDTLVAVPIQVQARIGDQLVRTWALYTGIDPASAGDLAGNVDATDTFWVLNRFDALRDGGLSPEGLSARVRRSEEHAFPTTFPTIGGRQMSPLQTDEAYQDARSTARANNEKRIDAGEIDRLDLVVPMQNGRAGFIEGITRGEVVSLLEMLQRIGQLRNNVSLNDVLAANGLGPLIGTDAEGRAAVRPQTPSSPTQETEIPDPWETPPEVPPTPAPDEPPALPPAPERPALPPASPPDQLLLPGAGESSSPINETPDADSDDGGMDGGDGNGGTGSINAAGGPDPEEPDPEPNLNALQRWLKKSIENWQNLPGDAATRSQQFRELIAATINTVGKGFLITNTLGAAGGAIFYGGIQEQRTSDPVTPENAKEELARLQDDPLEYLTENYTNAFAGINVGDRLYNMSGNLLEMANADGSLYHFRRVPEDLFNALRDAQVAQGIDVSDGVFVTEEYVRDGEPETLTVEIRPPFRAEPLRDAQLSLALAEDSQPHSFGFRGNLRFGPPEGQNLNIDVDAFFNYRYQTPTVSTMRLGLPSETNSDIGLGLRQQNTTIWSRLGISATALDFNPYQINDLTDPSSPLNDSRLTIANGRLYLAIGNRDRVRLDMTGTGADLLDPSGGYLRARETGFIELGLGGDFARFGRGDEWFSANFYNELQAYGPDLRAQGGTSGASGGLKPFPPLLELDSAGQISTNALPRITPEMPGLTAEPLQMGEPLIIRPFIDDSPQTEQPTPLSHPELEQPGEPSPTQPSGTPDDQRQPTPTQPSGPPDDQRQPAPTRIVP
ncbi:MAG: hypothetical protein JJU21_15570 [Salinarimonas sp.]|nr:hypothetical protein [Salinarimonas sp.]